MIEQDNHIVKSESKLEYDLYIIATPIGNMGDISFRALEVLKSVDTILCEDTRTSGKLLTHYGINTHRLPYHEHNAQEMRPKVISMIKQGKKLALISDAGMPLVSDPGYKLMQDCIEEEVSVTCIPGASACINALVLSGMPTDKFFFAGFLPNKSSARKTAIKEIEDITATVMFYETANRLVESLEDLHEVLGDRKIAVVRELTKKFEEVRRGKLSEVIDFYKENGDPRGEIVLVLEGAEKGKIKFSQEEIEDMLLKALETMRVKDASAAVAEKTGVSKKDVYQLALKLKEEK